jgi:hypothetical protein
MFLLLSVPPKDALSRKDPSPGWGNLEGGLSNSGMGVRSSISKKN